MLCLFVGAAAWVVYQIRQSNRDLALEKVARRLGLNFRFGLPQDLREMLSRFRAMETAADRGGEVKAGVNSITGSWNGRRIAFFDYEWSTPYNVPIRRSWWRGGGYDHTKVQHTRRRSAVAIELGVGLQPVLIRPEGLVDKAMALAGYDDIDVAQLPEFSDEFYVNSPDRAAARRLITPTLAQFFRDHVRCTVDIVGPWMLLTRNAQIPASGVTDLMTLAGRLSELVTREQAQSR